MFILIFLLRIIQTIILILEGIITIIPATISFYICKINNNLGNYYELDFEATAVTIIKDIKTIWTVNKWKDRRKTSK